MSCDSQAFICFNRYQNRRNQKEKFRETEQGTNVQIGFYLLNAQEARAGSLVAQNINQLPINNSWITYKLPEKYFAPPMNLDGIIIDRNHIFIWYDAQYKNQLNILKVRVIKLLIINSAVVNCTRNPAGMWT